MAQISINTEEERDLTVIRFSGMVGGGSLNRAVERFYNSESTNNVLWDFSNCDPTMVAREDILQILYIAKEKTNKRVNGKSAFVAPTDLSFGLARMAKSIAEEINHPVQAAVFRTEEEALAWLTS